MIDKVQQRIIHRFDWPGLRKACERWVNACLACLQVKDPRKMKFPLKSVESSELNEVVQIDHQKICMTESRYNLILVIIYHFTNWHKQCRDRQPRQRRLVTTDNTLNITIWLSHDISVGQRQSVRGGPDERIDKEVAHSSSTLNDLPFPDQRVGAEAE